MDDLVTIYRKIIKGSQKSWVLFENGTCVILMKPESDLKQQAIELLRQWGPVRIASPAGDITVQHLSEYPGYMVYGHHPDIIVYVSPTDAGPNAHDAEIGLLGRSRRDKDGHSLQVIHVEDKRSESAQNR